MTGRARNANHGNRQTAQRRRARRGAAFVAALATAGLLWCDAAFAKDPRVLLLRGWFGVFSTGLDGLADELKAKGVNAEVVGHLYWETAVSEIVRDRGAQKVGPIVLIGHSQGANNVIDMARALETHKIPVDLLVTLAPFMQYPVPANVVRAMNFYQSPGWGAPLAPANGFRGKLSNIDMHDDWTVTHINIDKSPKVHADIIREVVSVTSN